MSTTFLRGLAMIEIVGVDGPVSIGELARRVDADKATVSRMVTAAAVDGWLTRTSAGVVLGPRLSVLAHTSELTGALARAQTLIDAVAGVTGLFVQLYLVIGRGALAVASGGRPPIALPRPPGLELPIWSIAGGRAAASLIPRRALESMILDGVRPEDPLPGAAAIADVGAAVASGLGEPAPAHGGTPPTTGASFLAAVDEIRSSGVAYDHGDVHPLVHCVAVPWPGLGEPAGVCALGSPAQLAASGSLAEAVLRAAVDPSASRESVVQRAAAVANGERPAS